MKVLILGLGSIGHLHERVLKQQNCSVETYDPISSDATYHSYNDIPFSSYDGFLVCNPSKYHVESMLELVAYDKPIFVEKPLFLRFEEGSVLRKLSDKSLKNIYVAFNYRYHPAVDFMIDLVRKGTLGKLLNISLRFSHRLAQQRIKSNGIYALDKDQGGVWLDVAPHDLLATMAIFPNRYSGNCINVASDELPFHDSVVSGNIQGQNGPSISFNFDLVSPLRRRSMSILGDKGIFEWDEIGKPPQLSARLCLANNEINIINLDGSDTMFEKQANDFLKVISGEGFRNTSLLTASTCIPIMESLLHLRGVGKL